MRDRGLQGLGVDRDAAAVVGREAGSFEVQFIGRADAAGREEQHLAHDDAAVVEPTRQHTAAFGRIDARDRGAEPHRHVAVAEVMRELLDQLAIDEVEERGPRLDQRHRDVEGAEDRRIFDPDHTGPDHRHAAGQARQIDDLVRIEDRRAVERHIVGPERARSASDERVFRGVDLVLAAVARHLDAVRADVAGFAAGRLHGVAAELMLENLDLVVERFVQAGDEVGRTDILLDPVGAAIEAALAPARQVQHGFAQGLRRDRPGMDRNAADRRPSR